MMNILVLSNCPPVESQGSGYVIANTAKSLRSLGHTVEIVSPDTLDLWPSWKSRARNYRMTAGMGRWVYRNRKKVAAHDLVIFYGAECALAVYVIKKLLKLPVRVVLHSNGLEVHANHRLKKLMNETETLQWYHFDQSWMFRYAYRFVDAIINVSKYERDFAVNELGLPPKKVYYLEPSLPDAFFDFADNLALEKKPVMAYCGTWIARKGVDAIKEAVPQLLRKFPAYTFRIIGAGNEFKAEDHFSPDLLDRIEVHPFIESKQRMMELYSDVSVFLFPSVYESFGLVVAEALFCGCAAVCGRTGFAACLRHGEEALLLDDPTAANLYAAAEEVMSNETLRKRLSVRGKKRTADLHWKGYTQRLNIIINDVLAAGYRPAQTTIVADSPAVSGVKA